MTSDKPEPFDLTGFTFAYEEGASETPELIAALAAQMGDHGFKPSSSGMTMIMLHGVEYLADIDAKLKHITIGLCEYVDGGVLDAGPFKGKRMMMPTMKKRLDG